MEAKKSFHWCDTLCPYYGKKQMDRAVTVCGKVIAHYDEFLPYCGFANKPILGMHRCPMEVCE